MIDLQQYLIYIILIIGLALISSICILMGLIYRIIRRRKLERALKGEQAQTAYSEIKGYAIEAI